MELMFLKIWGMDLMCWNDGFFLFMELGVLMIVGILEKEVEFGFELFF